MDKYTVVVHAEFDVESLEEGHLIRDALKETQPVLVSPSGKIMRCEVFVQDEDGCKK